MQTTLYFRQGSSDKVYQASIEERDSGYVVNFAYGRRGSTLRTGSKTKEPVSYDKAKIIYEKLLKAKMAKGYTEGEDGRAYSSSEKANKVSGIQCQLLNPIEESELNYYLGHPDYVMQEKFDGERRLIQRKGDQVEGINRNGLFVGGVSQPIIDAALEIRADSFVLDGEDMGDSLMAFDLLEMNGHDLTGLPYSDRLRALYSLFRGIDDEHPIRPVVTAFEAEKKEWLLQEVIVGNGEGVVIKNYHAPYEPGRPHRGGNALKYKLYDTLSAIVDKVNDDRRSVALCLLDDEQKVSVGNCTIPVNKLIPTPGTIVEVRYLYATSGGILYQPTYLGERTDIPMEECRVTQMKFKKAA